jgi:nicotinate phosphoribosyltransferase
MQHEDLLSCVMREGEAAAEERPVDEIAHYVRERMNRLSEEHKRFEFPHIYKVGISRNLLDLRTEVVRGQKMQEGDRL